MKGFSAAYGFLGALLGGAALGYLVDAWLGSQPWGLVLGILLGFGSGLYALYVALARTE